MRFFTSNNMICRREDFNAVGGFSLAFKTAAAEDREFCNRWLVTGNSLVHARDAVVFHAHELSAGKFWHQHFNYGRGAFKFHKLRAAARQGPISIEPIIFYAKLMASPFERQLENPLTLCGLLFLSQVANASGFFNAMASTALEDLNRDVSRSQASESIEQRNQGIHLQVIGSSPQVLTSVPAPPA